MVTSDDDTLETQIELYDSDVKRLKYVYSDKGTAKLLYDSAKAGLYYIKVARRSYTSGYGSYRLSLNHTPPQYLPPSQVSVMYVYSQPLITWEVSSDDAKIDGYRICRSRSDVFREPVECGTIGTVEGIHAAESNTTVAVGFAGAGKTSFRDPIPLTDGDYYYWVTAKGPDGESEPAPADYILTGTDDTWPAAFRIHKPFPNPFNPSTTLCYELPNEMHVRIEIFDITGRRIAIITDGIRSPGSHEAVWDGRDDNGQAAASGVYLFRFSAGAQRALGKMTMVR
jgi:hypothetical protein